MSLHADVRQALQEILADSNVRLKFRQGNSAEWTAANPTLLSGEPGFEIDSRKEKRGDGATDWNDLPYISDGFVLTEDLIAYTKVETPEKYGAVGDGVTDDAAAINAALATGKNVLLGNKTYAIASTITVSNGQTLSGSGGMRNGRGSVIKILNQHSIVKFIGDAPVGANFTVDAGNVADIGVQVGGTAAGEAGSDGLFSNIMSGGARVCNWYFAGSQNFLVQSCRSQNGLLDGVIIDYSVGGSLFERFEFAGASRYNLWMTQSLFHVGGYGRPADNVFNKCIFEQSYGDNPQIFIEKGYVNTFNQPSIYSSHANPTTALVKVSGLGVVVFNDPYVLGQPGQLAFEAVNLATEGNASLAVQGCVQNPTTNGVLFKCDATSTIYYTGFCPQVISGAVAMKTASTSIYQIRNEFSIARYPVGQLASDSSELSKVRGDTQFRFVKGVDGSMLWGSGATPGDTNLFRYGPGVLATSKSMRATRSVFPTVAISPTVGGVVTVDASLSQKQAVYLSNAATSLVVNNMHDGQRLTLTFTMPPVPTALALASATGTQEGGAAINGFQWQGGYPPTLSRGNYAVTSEFLMIGGFMYEVGRSSTEFSLWVDTAANMAALVPKAGQKVYETDTARTREGDGVTAVANLPMDPKNWRTKGAGRWRMTNDYGLGVAAVVVTDGLITYVPWDIDEPVTIDTWGLTRTVVGVGGVQTAVPALYAAHQTTFVPWGAPLFGLETKAPVLDLTAAGSVPTIQSAALTSSVTIPPGRYYVATRHSRTGAITTNCSLTYLAGFDPRLNAQGGFNFYTYGSAYYQAGQTSWPTNPAIGNTTWYGIPVWLRQTA